MAVAFFPRSDELYFIVAVFDLGCSEMAKHRDVRFPSQSLPQGIGYANTAPDDHDVDVIRRTFEKEVAHVAAYDVAFESECIGSFGNTVKNILIEQFCQLGIG